MNVMSRLKIRFAPYGMALLLAGCGTLPPVAREPVAPRAPVIKSEPAPPPVGAAPSQPAVTQPLPETPPVTTEPLPPPAEITVQPMPAPPAPAVVALLDSAGRQEQAGQLESAAATLERALRVAPRNGTVWYRLARVRLAQGQWQAAANLAAKSNSLAGADAGLRKLNWTLIAKARERLGDKAGARAARAQAAEQQ